MWFSYDEMVVLTTRCFLGNLGTRYKSVAEFAH
jgi:hypothetical protein